MAEAPDLVPWGYIWTGSEGPTWDPVALLLLKLSHILLASGESWGFGDFCICWVVNIL